ncbi:MAG: DUF2065 family protein [Acidobacteriota bacterium]|nr:MAG: DUF2065 family protein [Acidobacteriota bacterium]
MSALALMLVLEGLPYFASPASAREVLAWISSRSDRSLRSLGLALIVSGLAGFVLIRALLD